MDYTKFLQRKETVRLPFFGGHTVDARDRSFRIETSQHAELAPGWWEFEIVGRRAKPLKECEPEPLDGLDKVAGHFADGWLFEDGKSIHRFALPLEMEPEPLAIVTARRWHSGHLLFDSTEFEDEAEMDARMRLSRAKASREFEA